LQTQMKANVHPGDDRAVVATGERATSLARAVVRAHNVPASLNLSSTADRDSWRTARRARRSEAPEAWFSWRATAAQLARFSRLPSGSLRSKCSVTNCLASRAVERGAYRTVAQQARFAHAPGASDLAAYYALFLPILLRHKTRKRNESSLCISGVVLVIFRSLRR
jgi:hypothetical protein